MTATETLRIYVASLSDYNSGILHGKWIDANQDVDAIYAEVREMLAASPAYKEFPEGGPAEEWAIHDYDGFGNLRLGEWESFAKVAAIAEKVEEHGEPFLAWLSVKDEIDADTFDDFEEEFCGEWESEREFSEQLADELGIGGLPGTVSIQKNSWGGSDEVNVVEALGSYIDWDTVVREDFQHGDYTSVKTSDYKVYVFRENR